MITLFLVRHGIAEEPSPGTPDSERRLTREGRVKTQRAMRGLMSLRPELDVILTSPLARARETAEILASEVSAVEVEVFPALASGEPTQALCAALATRTCRSGIALVGHEPDLGEFASYILTGDENAAHLRFRKAGVATFEVESLAQLRPATLRWFLSPSLLRRLA
jgi:phosphohistidine phosphatase